MVRGKWINGTVDASGREHRLVLVRQLERGLPVPAVGADQYGAELVGEHQLASTRPPWPACDPLVDHEGDGQTPASARPAGRRRARRLVPDTETDHVLGRPLLVDLPPEFGPDAGGQPRDQDQVGHGGRSAQVLAVQVSRNHRLNPTAWSPEKAWRPSIRARNSTRLRGF